MPRRGSPAVEQLADQRRQEQAVGHRAGDVADQDAGGALAARQLAPAAGAPTGPGERALDAPLRVRQNRHRRASRITVGTHPAGGVTAAVPRP